MTTTRKYLDKKISELRKKGGNMSTREVMDKIILATLGAWIMTRDEADKVFEDLKNSTREDFIKELTDRSFQAKQRMEEAVSERAKQVGESLNLASQKHMTNLEKRMDVMALEMRRMESKLDELSPKKEG
jgi:polyhydroxyalkanoate synthesis regulator phasin